MADDKKEYLGDFGGAPQGEPGHGQAAEEAHDAGFKLAKTGIQGKPDAKAVASPPATKAIQAPPETR